MESKWILTIKSVVSQGDKFCLPRRQILSPTETNLNLSPRETDFVPGRDRVSNGTVVRGGGLSRFEMSAPRRCSLRARSLSGDCGAVKRAFSGDVARRRDSSLARFVVHSKLNTEKVYAIPQEVTELEREVARAYARSRRGKSRTVGDDRHRWFLALAAIAQRGYADARDRLASS